MILQGPLEGHAERLGHMGSLEEEQLDGGPEEMKKSTTYTSTFKLIAVRH